MLTHIAQFITYMAYSGIILICLYFIYKLFLCNTTHHGFNRLYLMLSYVVAFALLPLQMFFDNAMRQPVAHGRTGVSISDSDALSLPQWMVLSVIGIYIAGVAIMLAITLANMVKIARINRGGTRHDGNIVFTADDRFTPFGWGGRIFISEKDYAENGEAILIHESSHISHHHWIDIMLAQLAIIFNWFNPAAWLLLRELKNVHEYQADAAVADSGLNIKQYQLMLIRKTAGIKFSMLANCLNHGLISKRINMMLSKPTPKRSMMGAFLSIPAVVAVIMFVNFDSMATSMTHSLRPTTDWDETEWIIDGKPLDYESLEGLDPDRIKSITVTKDPKTHVIIELKDK